MRLGDMVIVQEGNPYHEWKVRGAANKQELRIRRLNWTERDIRKCRYSGILDTKEVVWFVVGRMSASIKKEIERIKLQRRIVVFEVERGEQRNWLQGILVGGRKMESLPPVKTWEEKTEECIGMLGSFRAEFSATEVQRQLVRMMILDTECWSDVKLSIDMARVQNKVIDKNFLQDMFPDMDFYRLDDWILGVLAGKWKGKGVKIAHYFRHEKEYSNVWLMQKLRGRVNDIALVYEAYRLGVIYGEMGKAQILERSKVIGWEGGTRLSEMKRADQRWCLRAIEELPYPYFVTVQRLMYGGSNIVTEDWDIYRYIEEIRVNRGEYNARNGGD